MDDQARLFTSEDKIVDSRRPGWFWAYNEIISDDRISHSAFRLYCALCSTRHFFEKHPGVRWLSNQASLNKETVCIALKELESAGLIKITKNHGIGMANTYTILEEVYGKTGQSGSVGHGETVHSSKEREKEREKVPRQKKDRRMDPKQNIIPWMKAQLSGRSWQNPTAPMENLICKIAEEQGREFVQRAWLDFVDHRAARCGDRPFRSFLGELTSRRADSNSGRRPFKHTHKLTEDAITQADIDYARKWGKIPPELYNDDGSERTLEERTKEMEGWVKP
jgi:DNA-binding transcriptional regulator YhcF (GntR family)